MPASQFGYRNPATKRLRGPVNIKLAPILLPQLFGGVLTVLNPSRLIDSLEARQG